MRSIIGFAVLVAAIGFSGCCSNGGAARGLLTGGGCKLLGKKAACGGECSVVESGDCGCGGEFYSDQGMMDYGPTDGGCGCGGGAPVVSPMQFDDGYSSDVYSDVGYDDGGYSSGGCSSCDGASTQRRGLFNKDRGNGMGMKRNGKGLACGTGIGARSLRPQRTRPGLVKKFGFAKTEGSIVSSEGYDLVSDEYVVGCDEHAGGVAGRIGGRRISHGIISDFREVHGRVRGSSAGCGRGGCGHKGALCGACNLARTLTGQGSGNPYGGAIPHTAKQPGQSGMAPSYAYPYYTTRGPRDFLRDNPPSIGR